MKRDVRGELLARPEGVQLYIRMRAVRMSCDDDVALDTPAKIARYVAKALDEWKRQIAAIKRDWNPAGAELFDEDAFARSAIDKVRANPEGLWNKIFREGTN
jgi:hypothetical protein